jgi:hypothetical protein
MLTPNTRVRVLGHRIPGHCRTPYYLKGREGVVIEDAGTHRNPEQLAYFKPGLPLKRLYRVRFLQRELWPDYAGAEGDVLEADLYEHWLEPIDKKAPA